MLTTMMSLVVATIPLAGCRAQQTGQDRLPIGGCKVPFVAQEDRWSCGPAALACVYGYYGLNGLNQADIARRLRGGRQNGTLDLAMVLDARERSFDALIYRGGLGDLSENLKTGVPIIMEWKVLGGFHCAVAVGIDEERGVVYCHDGYRAARPYPVEQLMRYWQPTGCASIRVTPRKESSHA